MPLRTELPSAATRHKLGHTALSVSPYCIGMVTDPAVISHAFDRGINFFFVSADMHWPLYEGTRRGLMALLNRSPDIRSKIVVAAVSYVTQPEFCVAPFSELIDAIPSLGTLDLLLAGGAYPHDLPPRAPVYQQHRATNYLGTAGIGATFHGRAAAANALDEGWMDIAFVRYSAMHPGAASDVFPHVSEPRQTKLYGFKSMTGYITPDQAHTAGIPGGHWIPDPVDQYRFALSRTEFDGVLVAPRTTAEVDQLVDAANEGPLSAEEEEHMLLLGEILRGLSAFDGTMTGVPTSITMPPGSRR